MNIISYEESLSGGYNVVYEDGGRIIPFHLLNNGGGDLSMKIRSAVKDMKPKPLSDVKRDLKKRNDALNNAVKEKSIKVLNKKLEEYTDFKISSHDEIPLARAFISTQKSDLFSKMIDESIPKETKSPKEK